MEPNIPFLESLKNRIEKLSKTEHIEILKIIKNNPSVKLNENKSGVYINLTFLPESILEQITQYLNYIQQQESMLNPMEKEKMDFKKIYFIEKENKEDVTSIYSYSS